MLLMDNGKQCTISGLGPMFEEFLRSGEVKHFTGFKCVPAKFHEEHFEEAPLRIMSFADTYGNMHYDCSQSFCSFHRENYHTELQSIT